MFTSTLWTQNLLLTIPSSYIVLRDISQLFMVLINVHKYQIGFKKNKMTELLLLRTAGAEQQLV